MDNPLVRVDPGLFIWTIATFLLLLWLLARFAWKPLLKALEERQRTIARALDDAQKAREELERVQAEAAKLLAAARVEAEGIVTKTRADAALFGEDLRQKSAADAAALVKKAEREIQFETSRAVEQVRREAVDLSVAIASKLLRRNVSKDDNQALIDDAIKQFDTIRH